MHGHTPQPAPLARRTEANAIDAELLLLGLAGWTAFIFWRGSRRAVTIDRRRRLGDAIPTQASHPTTWRALALAAAIAFRAVGTPGERVAGLRSVDPRTGRPPTLWLVLYAAAFREARQWLGVRVTRRLMDDRRGARDSLLATRGGEDLDPEEAERLHQQSGRGCLLVLLFTAAQAIAIGLTQRRLRAAGHYAGTIKISA